MSTVKKDDEIPSYKHEWKDYFPFNFPRKEQEEAINEAIHAIKSGKKFIILDLPVGIGKSAIGLTLAKWAEHNLPHDEKFLAGANFITTQKILQDQYMKDFAKHGMKSIKSSSNYSCSHEKSETCASAPVVYNLAGPKYDKWKEACKGMGCHYRQLKNEWLESPLAITSMSYFLTDSRKIKNKQLLIIDEAHTVEQSLMSFVEVTLNKLYIENELGITLPHLDQSESGVLEDENFKNWLFGEYFKILNTRYNELSKQVDKIREIAPDHKIAKEIFEQYEVVKSNYDKVERLKDSYDGNPNNWIYYIEHTTWRGKPNTMIRFKPINIKYFADSKLLYKKAKYIICMSATIINGDEYCKNSGIGDYLNKGQVHSIEKDSPFPVKNRRVIYYPVAPLSKKEIDVSLPKIAEQIKELLEMHEGEKGIIHCHSYKVSSFIMSHVKSKRLITHSSSDRDKILQEHCNSKIDSVLVSPSMAEGVDLKDDLSRFQIICKIPFPYMGDRQIKKKMEIDPMWYSYETIKTLVQSTGRSVRSADDYAITYILDSTWGSFYNRNRRIFPLWFKRAYVDVTKD